MAFQLSPGVQVTESDLTSIVPAVATSTGGFAGVFAWGPVLDPTLISSENQLVARFGRPNRDSSTVAQSFFTAANFLSYTNSLYVVRADLAGAKNAVALAAGAMVSAAVTSPGTGFTDIPTVAITGGTGTGGTATATLKVVNVDINTAGTGWATNDTFTVNIGSGVEATFKIDAQTAGVPSAVSIISAGNYTDIIAASLVGVATAKITSATGAGLTVDLTLGLNTVTVSGGDYTVAPTLNANGSNGGTGSVIATPALTLSGLQINNEEVYMDDYVNGTNGVGTFAAKYPGTLGNSIKVSMADSASYTAWAYKDEFDGAPNTTAHAAARGGSQDEMHVIVIDELGLWTGIQGGILEKFAYVSKASDARKLDGANNYYRDVINSGSKYVWWMDHPAAGTNWGTLAQGTAFATMSSASTATLVGGADDFNDIDQAGLDSALTEAFGLLANAERYDISLIPAGGAGSTVVAKYVIEQVAEARKDCVAFVSPYDSTGNKPFTDAQDIVDWRTAVGFNVSSSYGVMDSGYKYQYDRYNDIYRWVPLNGDMAGLCARTDYTNDAWWSPGGLNRGQIKNVVKLAFNPNKAERDLLYRNGVNPVVSFPGQGVVLFGDKTLLAKPSAFDRINVRRLFIVLEKAIATAAKYQLFEFNDSFTRAQFRALVEPFLRDVQGRRGVIDFRVKCDGTNNTAEVIDRNEFVADIFVKPTRSINFISLNFVAARTGISFDEIGG